MRRSGTAGASWAGMRVRERSALATAILTREEEEALARLAKAGDRRAESRLVEAHMRMAFRAARMMSGHGVEAEDLVSAGALGLVTALRAFDPERGLRFSTFASFHVRAEVCAQLLASYSNVRFVKTAATKRVFFWLARARAALRSGGAEPGREEATALIAAWLRVSPEDVRVVWSAMEGRDASLNAPVGEDGVEAIDLMADASEPVDERLGREQQEAIRRGALRSAMGMAEGRDRRILEARHMGEEAATLRDLAAEHSVSTERVRQIEIRALRRLAQAARAVEAKGSAAAMAGA